MTPANNNEFARKALTTDDATAIVYALLAIAEEVAKLNSLFASVMREKGGLVVEVSD